MSEISPEARIRARLKIYRDALALIAADDGDEPGSGAIAREALKEGAVYE